MLSPGYITIAELDVGYKLRKEFIYSGLSSRGNYVSGIASDEELLLLETTLEHFQSRLYSMWLSESDPLWPKQKQKLQQAEIVSPAGTSSNTTPSEQEQLKRFVSK